MISLFKPNETSFEHNGLGSLDKNIINPVISEDLNGIFKLSFTYPIFAPHGPEIQGQSVVRAPVPGDEGGQLFRVYRPLKSMGYLEVSAYHIFYDLIDNFIEDTNVVGKNGQGAVQQILGATQYNHNFRGTSDISTTTNARLVRMNPVEALLDEKKGNSFVSRWGGELKRDNFNVRMMKNIGANRGKKIRHRKDLIGYEADVDFSSVVTRIMPQGFDGLLLPEKYIDSPLISSYVYPKIKKLEYSDIKAAIGEYADDEDAIPLEDALQLLREEAEKEYFVNKIDIPNATYRVDFVALDKTEEYKDLQDLQTILIGDIVTVIHEEDSLEIEAKMISYDYNPLDEKYLGITLGNFKNIFTDVRSETISLIDQLEETTKNTIQTAANGKNRIFRGVTEPNKGMMVNDLWYKPVGEGETMLYTWNGGIWELSKVSAGLLAGTLDAENGDVNLINVNVANIVGETSEFVQYGVNGINNSIRMDTDGLRSTATNGDWTLYHAGAISFGSSVRPGIYLEFADNNRNGISILNRENISDEISFDLRSDTRNTLNFGMQTDTSGYDFRIDHYQGTKVSFQGRDVKRYTFNLNSDNQMGAISMVAHGNTGYSGGSSYSIGYETADGATKGSRFYFSSASDLVWLSKETYNDLQPLAVYDLQFRWGQSGRKSLKDVLDYLSRAAGVDINNIPDVY